MPLILVIEVFLKKKKNVESKEQVIYFHLAVKNVAQQNHSTINKKF